MNMAYTRIKNLNVGYTLPVKLVKRAKLQTARIYFSGENLFTIDNLKEPTGFPSFLCRNTRFHDVFAAGIFKQIAIGIRFKI